LLLLALVRVAVLPFYPLMDPTEARYADIARQMIERGDWVTPWFSDGRPFWGKPPLAFWLSAASMQAFGINAFAARLPHWLLGVALIALVAWHARPVSRRYAWHAAALTAGSALFLVASGAVMTDMALTLGITLVMVGFERAVLRRSPIVSTGGQWMIAAGACIGLLAKGPVAVVLCGVPLAAWTLWTGRVGVAWRSVAWLRGAALVALVVAPWYVLAELRTPGFLSYFFIGEHWHRFMTPGWHGDLYGSAHAFPRGAIWVFALAAFVPWSVLVPLAWLRRPYAGAVPSNHDEPGVRSYWALWALTPPLFFTFAGNVLWTYVLPSLAPAALLVAGWTARLTRPKRVDALLAASLLAWSVAMTAALAILHARDEFTRWSTAWVFDTVQRQADATTTPLIFIAAKLPFSASFYSHGQAQRVDGIEGLTAARVCPSAFVAVPAEFAVAHLETPGRHVARLGAGSRFTLVRIGCDRSAPAMRPPPPARGD
jgi:4-amino-4-deoxy-L-arabinose transferase-like glycosyltransferase